MGPRFIDRIQKAAKVPATTAAFAIQESLKRMGIKDVIIVTPYFKEWNERLISLPEAFGVTVHKDVFLSLDTNHKLADVSPKMIYKLAQKPT